jgi:hypothetical protein
VSSDSSGQDGSDTDYSETPNRGLNLEDGDDGENPDSDEDDDLNGKDADTLRVMLAQEVCSMITISLLTRCNLSSASILA